MKKFFNTTLGLSMLGDGEFAITTVTAKEAAEWLVAGYENVANPSHGNSLQAVSQKLGVDVRDAKGGRVSLSAGDECLVAQISGIPRETREFSDQEIDEAEFSFRLVQAKATRPHFFLGGKDAEMEEIRRTLEEAGVMFSDFRLDWGAKALDYSDPINGDLIAGSAGRGETPVLVELEVDQDVPEGIVVVDHHGDRAGEPPAILQVLALLGRLPTRHQRLIGANDSGYIPAILALGASSAEVDSIRVADRRAQGINPLQEEQALSAIVAAEAEEKAEAGELVVVRMVHSKCATVTDRLFQEWKDGRENLLILSEDGEANYFGDGSLCSVLKEKFDGWNGGSGLGKSGETAFWGGYPDQDEVEIFVRSWGK